MTYLVVLASAVLFFLAGFMAGRPHGHAAKTVPQQVDYESTAACLNERWDQYNQTLAQEGKLIHFCETFGQVLEANQ